jgi:hypothetical protein
MACAVPSVDPRSPILSVDRKRVAPKNTFRRYSLPGQSHAFVRLPSEQEAPFASARCAQQDSAPADAIVADSRKELSRHCGQGDFVRADVGRWPSTRISNKHVAVG